MTRNGIAAVALLSVVVLAGCQSARYVVRESDHGVVAIPVGSERYRREAEQLMQEHFPDGYTVVREEEVPVEDSQTTSEQVRGQLAEQGSRPFAGAAAPAPGGGLLTDRQRLELRITYFRDQPASPLASAGSTVASRVESEFEAGESLFSTAGMIDRAATSN